MERPLGMVQILNAVIQMRRSFFKNAIVAINYNCSFIIAGLVFLQYRNETKRALLPNEITTLDTVTFANQRTHNFNPGFNYIFYKVRALFVRSFGDQLNMKCFDSPNVRIYIHDPNQGDLFYELEDIRYAKL